MKRVLLIAMILVAFLHSCSSDKTLDGKWVAKDIDIEMEISCECTDKQKAQMKEVFMEGMKEEMGRIKSSYYYILRPDHSILSVEEGRERKGTYEIDGDEVIANYDDSSISERAKIIGEGDDIKLSSSPPEEKLNEMTETFEHPEYGTVRLMFTKMKSEYEKVQTD